ncbi:hypothetical protein NHX12_005349 [Muraenolepis orangiensis]|uniref:PH domain-containing protein n=1 Tax=Muraenolepis orangiensis TaxID=630683 RepID=A0A9Q0DSS1_9TELE|nr:hypothetical protein NHX12_005349 [Muraenolepis orangiensis]
MDNGVTGDPARPKEARFLSKAGWVKKATGRLLAGYKDRYIHVEKTEVVVYENEDLKTCLERLDLENFEKCHELKSIFNKKNRLVLIRAPKCANKIHDVKIQAETPQEKDAWIKALSEGINRAKNKIFDEIKVDESINLDHVTRTRPKGNRSRRPPTRIHMKEVANISSDGILRLDLDVPNAMWSNGDHYVNIDFTEPLKENPPMPTSSTSDATEKRQSSSPQLEEPQTVVEPSPQKKIFKPPMPPSKDRKAVSATENGPSVPDGPEKVPGPPKPPSKELKPSHLPAEQDTQDLSERVPVAGAGENIAPSKPISSSTEDLAESLSPVQETRSPTIPPKDKKPSKDPDRNGLPSTLEGTSDEIIEKVSELDPSSCLPTVKQAEVGDFSESHCTAEATPEPISVNSTPSGLANNVPSSSNNLEKERSETATLPTLPSFQMTRKCPSPLPPLKKKPLKLCPPKPLPPLKQPKPEGVGLNQPTGNDDTTVTQHEDSSSSATQLETVPSICSTCSEETPGPIIESHNDVPRLVVTLSKPVAVEADLSHPACGFPAEKTEDISDHSICHSDGDSVDSGSEDNLASSTFALRGSQVGLDSLYASEDDGEEYSNNPEQISDAAPPGTRISQVTSSVQINLIKPQPPKLAPPPIPLKPTAKLMSASLGDLLSSFSETETEKRHRSRDISQRDSGDGLTEVQSIERGIALELEQTKELLSCTSQTQGEGLGKNMPEDLLAKAMQKLRMADHLLKEAKNFEQSKRLGITKNRSSW